MTLADILLSIWVCGIPIAAVPAGLFLSYKFTSRDGIEVLGTVAMVLVWPIVLGTVVMCVLANAWTSLLERRRYRR